MNVAAQQDLRTSLLEACHPATLVKVLRATRDSGLGNDLLAADAAVCAVMAGDARLAGAIPQQRLDSTATDDTLTALQQSLIRLAVQRLSAPLSPARANQIHQAHVQALIRARVARQLAEDLGYPNGDEAYRMGLLLRVNELVMPRHTDAGETLTLQWFQQWGLPVAAQDALRYRDASIQDLQGLHLLTLLLRLADDYSHPERRAACPESPRLDQLVAEASIEAAAQLPWISTSELQDAVATRLHASGPAAAHSGATTALQAAVGPVALRRFELDANQQILRGTDAACPLAFVRIPLEATRSIVADAFLRQEWTHCHEEAGASPVDEQISRLLGRAHLLALPEQDGVWVAGLDDAQWMQYHARQSQLQAAIRKTGAGVPVPEREPQVNLSYCHEILHEASAPLTTVRNYLHVWSQRLPENAREELGLVRSELDRLSGILQQLRTVQDPRSQGLRAVNPVVAEVIRNLMLGGDGQTRLEADLDESLKDERIAADPLRQILINLIQNALDCRPPPSGLVVTTRRLLPPVHTPRMQLEISDNGPGLPESVRTRLFEPKKRHAAGHSGLGLSIVYKLVNQLGGEISCSSTSHGTRFQIILPLLASAEPTDDAHTAS